jgi:hypothetical protein
MLTYAAAKAQLYAKDRAILLSYSLYLLYWYKSTNTDAAAAAEAPPLTYADVC